MNNLPRVVMCDVMMQNGPERPEFDSCPDHFTIKNLIETFTLYQKLKYDRMKFKVWFHK